jgi:glycosyltransferase involved in cell wall biosynthesis
VTTSHDLPLSETREGTRRPLSVLHVSSSFDERMGGLIRAPLNICKYLAEDGVDVTVVATQSGRDDVDYLPAEYGGVRCIAFLRVLPEHNFRSPALFRWLRENVSRFDLVEIHGVFAFPTLYGVFACLRAGVPYILRPHGQLEPHDLRKHAPAKAIFGRLLVRPMLSHASSVLLTTQLEADRIVTYGAPVHGEVVTLPVQPVPVASNGDGFRNRHGIPRDATVVLFLGRFDDKKGLQYLLPALAAVKREHPHAWLLLVGDGTDAELQVLHSLVAKHGTAPWTTNCGFLSGQEKQSALAASDIFALPSRNENFGIAAVEAMYAGLALLLSREVYVSDVPGRSGAAVLCDPNELSCQAALRTLLEDSTNLRDRGRRARVDAQEHFAPKAATRELLRVYERVLGVDTSAGRGSTER